MPAEYRDPLSGQSSITRISTATTTTIKSGSGLLYGLVVGSCASSGTITIYDNTTGSGTVLFKMTSPATLLSNQVALPFPKPVPFEIGLTIVTTGAQDFSVFWV